MIDPIVAAAASAGLLANTKTLPAWLLYDATGCALYEKITLLPEYYLTRAEAEIFKRSGDAIIAQAREGTDRIAIAEIGAGTATKTETLLAAAVRAQRSVTYLACDIAPEPLEEVRARMRTSVPGVDVKVAVGTHREAVPAIAALRERQVLMFIGSSIGNYADDDAVALLRAMRAALRKDAVLILGTDLKKDPAVLRAAYDDSQGVTAAFSLNMLTRLNRDLAAHFDVTSFKHVALWNEATSNVEVFLESQREQDVEIGAFGHAVHFQKGERIHTEICAKYDLARVDRILNAAGFSRATTYGTEFGVHLARVA
ncbi:MAG TPA: L-histidine N(alpha)-methyltransferase [Myxococcota bacterium]|jgi:dimethylhistidine N-methyltransferase